MDRPVIATALAAALLVAPLAVADPVAAEGSTPDRSCRTDDRTPARDLRAMWVSSVANIDWPSKPGLSARQQRAELTGWLDLAKRQRHNAVVLQVRPTADAFWPSRFEPWSKYLTGTQGRDPGWDPLKFAVRAAHARGLQLHAWFNPFRVTQEGDDLNSLSPQHPARQHPEWTVAYGGKRYYNPGLPQVRRFVREAILDAVRRYDIDAVHFDDYFYPYPVEGETFDDADAYARYGQGRSVADWRRDNITGFVGDLGRRIHRIRAGTQFGISPFAIWRNAATDPSGSDTNAGAQTYDDLYADTRRWVREELIDYVAPQVYWSRGFADADYEKVTRWWDEQVRGTRVHLYAGQATYKVDDNADPAWSRPQELSEHLAFNTGLSRVEGNIFFSAKDVRENRLDATGLLNRTWYTRPALVPASPWLDERPGPPRRPRAATGHDGRLRWTPVRDAAQYAVYRVPGKRVHRCDLADARNLVAVLPARGRGIQQWRDPNPADGPVRYVVTAVDRAGLQSAPGPRT